MLVQAVKCVILLSICVCLFSNEFATKAGKSQLFQTGTTIVGICCPDGVVLGADTRSTGGSLIINKHTKKIHQISDSIFCFGAGTAGDCDQLKQRAAQAVAMDRVDRSLAGDYSRFDPIPAVLKTLTSSLYDFKQFTYRKPEAVFILGGVDASGPSLHQINTKGAAQRISYGSLGSGSYNAMCMLEHELGKSSQEHQVESLSLDQAISAVRRAVQSGITNDLGSGSHVDLCVIRCDGAFKMWREVNQDSVTNDAVTAGAEEISDSSDSTALGESETQEDKSTSAGAVVKSLGRLVAFRRSTRSGSESTTDQTKDVIARSKELLGIKLNSIDSESEEELQCSVEFIK